MRNWTEHATRTAYDEIAWSYAKHLSGTEAESSIDLAMIEHFNGILDGARHVLDAGCGAGRMMPRLGDLGCRVIGFDLSLAMLGRARSDHPQFPTLAASLGALPLADACVDGYFSWYSTIHTSDADLPLILAEARRVLRPGGSALFSFQTGEGPCDASRAYRDLGHDVVLMRYRRSLETFSKQLITAGFSIVASMQRTAAKYERDGQAVVIGQSH